MAPIIFQLNLSYFGSKTAILKIVELILCAIAVGTTTYAALNTYPDAMKLIIVPSVFTHVVINYAFFVTVLFVLICNVLSKPFHNGTKGTILESAWNGIFAIMFLATSIAVILHMSEFFTKVSVGVPQNVSPEELRELKFIELPFKLHLTGAVSSLLNSLILAVHAFLNAKELTSGDSSPFLRVDER